MAKTKVTMYISFVANIINVIGNIIGVYVLKAGVAGVAYPSLISRVFSAIIITILCFNKKLEAYYDSKDIFKFDGKMLKRILNIAIPNGVENGIFQLVKVALSSIVAMFGTYQIAANGVAQSIWSLADLWVQQWDQSLLPLLDNAWVQKMWIKQNSIFQNLLNGRLFFQLYGMCLF